LEIAERSAWQLARSAAMGDLDRARLRKTVRAVETARGEHLRGFLRDYNHADVIAALGEGDLLESIGIEQILDYVQSVGYGPASPERRFCRQRVIELGNGFECLRRD
jgi:hypothetical protein